MSIVIGLYDDLATAQQVVRELENGGFKKSDLHLATYDQRAERREPGGFFDSLSNLFSSKPKDVGGDTGNMVDQLTGWGVPQQDAQQYVDSMEQGSSMVLVNSPDDRAQDAKRIMDSFGPNDLDTMGGQQQGFSQQEYDREGARFDRGRQGQQDIAQGGETRIPEVEEELRTGKREVQRGGVRIHRSVTEQPVEETQMLRDETINVEHHDLDREPAQEDLNAAFQEGTFEVTETDEELVADKRAHVTGEVVVNKQVEERPETVRDTVRRTEVHTEDLGAGQSRGSRDFSAFDNDYRNHYDMLYGSRGQDYSYYEPGYRYGYDLAGSGRYQGRKWSEIEPDARREWERSHPQSSWDDFRDAIRFGWERASGMAPEGGQDFGTGYNAGTDQEGYGTGMGTDR